MRALLTAVYLAISAPVASLRSRALLGRTQIVLVEKLRAVRRRVLKRARFRWER
jgi:hypothetical protein